MPSTATINSARKFSRIVPTHVARHFFPALLLSVLLFASPKARSTKLSRTKVLTDIQLVIE
jgi:hypothetical protein